MKKKRRKREDKDKLFLIDAGTYPFDILCYFGDNRDKLLTKLKYNLTEAEALQLKEYPIKKGCTWIFENKVSLLWLPSIPVGIEQMGFLSHEIWHITDNILREVGMELSAQSTEAYAYLLQHLSVQIWGKLGITFS